MPDIQSPTEKKLADTPLYTCSDAARYLRIPIWHVIAVTDYHHRHPMDWIQRPWRKQYRDRNGIGKIEREQSIKRISFRVFTALFTTSVLVRPMTRRQATDYFYFFNIRVIGNAINRPEILTDPEWVVQHFFDGDIPFAKSESRELIERVAVHQSRIEMKDGDPVLLYPFSRDISKDAPRIVSIDPEIRFGQPAVKGVPTDVLAERWRGGDSSVELADDYNLSIEEVEEALRFESLSENVPFIVPVPPFYW